MKDVWKDIFNDECYQIIFLLSREERGFYWKRVERRILKGKIIVIYSFFQV